MSSFKIQDFFFKFTFQLLKFGCFFSNVFHSGGFNSGLEIIFLQEFEGTVDCFLASNVALEKSEAIVITDYLTFFPSFIVI